MLKKLLIFLFAFLLERQADFIKFEFYAKNYPICDKILDIFNKENKKLGFMTSATLFNIIIWAKK